MDPFDIISMSKDESAAVKCGTQYCIDKEEDYDLMPQFGPLKLVSVINVALRPKVERFRTFARTSVSNENDSF